MVLADPARLHPQKMLGGPALGQLQRGVEIANPAGWPLPGRELQHSGLRGVGRKLADALERIAAHQYLVDLPTVAPIVTAAPMAPPMAAMNKCLAKNNKSRTGQSD
jgi:hypothetical protein